MKKAAIYSRVSTLNDTQDGSFETQIEYYTKRIEEDDDTVLVGIYGDHGKSGRQIKGRPEFQRMINDCKNGDIDIIYTKSISRFARNMLECVEVIRNLISLDVEVVFEKEGISTKQMHSELFLSIFAAIAQAESVSIGENRKLADRRRNAIGRPGYKASYGYKKSPSGSNWEVIPTEATRIKLAFHLACLWYTYPEIRKELQRLEDKENTGKTWNQTPLIYMLKNVSYIGDVLTNKTYRSESESGLRCYTNHGHVDQYYIHGHHEALVSKEKFEIVQKILELGILRGTRRNFSDEEIELMNRAREITNTEWKDTEKHYGDGKNCNKYIQFTD